MAPGSNRIVDVFNGRFARAGDAREIHIVIRIEDQAEMLRAFFDEPVAMGKIGRQDARQFLLELHIP